MVDPAFLKYMLTSIENTNYVRETSVSFFTAAIGRVLVWGSWMSQMFLAGLWSFILFKFCSDLSLRLFSMQRVREEKTTLSTGKTGKFEVGPMKDNNHGSLECNFIVLIFR